MRSGGPCGKKTTIFRCQLWTRTTWAFCTLSDTNCSSDLKQECWLVGREPGHAGREADTWLHEAIHAHWPQGRKYIAGFVEEPARTYRLPRLSHTGAVWDQPLCWRYTWEAKKEPKWATMHYTWETMDHGKVKCWKQIFPCLPAVTVSCYNWQNGRHDEWKCLYFSWGLGH